jgi:uncharacterized protein
MTITLASFIGIYDRALATCAHLLEKGSAFAAENGVAEADLLNWRLVEDMHPLAFHVTEVVNFSRGYLARAAGEVPPERLVSADLDLAGLRAAIVDARAYLAAISADSLTGRDDVMEKVQIADTMAPTLAIGQWLSNFALTNVEFHTTMAYAIMRLKGVPLSKVDMFPAGL